MTHGPSADALAQENEMNIARLSIGYDRGVTRNDEETVKQHLGLFDETQAKAGAVKKAKDQTHDADGVIVRGLGTHFRSAADSELVKLRDADAKRLYTSWRETFLATPLEGVYIIPKPGAAREWVRQQQHRDDMTVRVSEFELVAPEGLEGAELGAWAARIKNQLTAVSLGRAKDADAKGLAALESLASCPVLSEATSNRIKSLVAQVREGKIDRVELKRQITTTNVEIEQAPLTVRRTLEVA